MTSRLPTIVATGSAVPPTIRTNDDPIFDWMKKHHPDGAALFTGYEDRHVLAPGESIVDYSVRAATIALQSASRKVADVDLLIGYISVGAYAMPNDLQAVAKNLGLSKSAMVVPINSEYANFNHGVLMADALMHAGHIRCALVVVGTNWTQFVDYHTPQSVSAGDGAGAAVMEMKKNSKGLYRVVDTATAADRDLLGSMFLSAEPTTPPRTPPTYGPRYFHLRLSEGGMKAFAGFGEHRPPALVAELLSRNDITPSDVAFVGHQTSEVLNRAWKDALKPGEFIQTLSTHANMTAATIPVNLDLCAAQITTPYVVLLALGPEPSCVALLLRRLD